MQAASAATMNVRSISEYVRACFKEHSSLHILSAKCLNDLLGKKLIHPPKISDDLFLVIYT